MSILRTVVQSWLLDDASFTNDPQDARLSYKLDIQENLTADVRRDMSLAAASTTDLTLSGGPFKWVYLLVDQPVFVRFDTNVDDTVKIEPSVNGAVPSTGVLLKRGTFSNVSIRVPGATAAKLIFMAGVS